jgi:anthranilate synthase component 1
VLAFHKELPFGRIKVAPRDTYIPVLEHIVQGRFFCPGKVNMDTLEQVKKTFQAHPDAKRIPLAKELMADMYTPIQIMKRLKSQYHHCFLLESASNEEYWGRYTFLGFDPSLEISGIQQEITIKDFEENQTQSLHANHPADAIRSILAQYKTPSLEAFPYFTGGLVGYFSYDYIRYEEPKLILEDHGQADFKDFDLMLFNHLIIFDHYRQKLILISGVIKDNIEESYAKACGMVELMEHLIKTPANLPVSKLELLSDLKPKFSVEEYAENVKKAKHYIHEGDIFQVVLSNPIQAQAKGSLFDTYRILRSTNPSPYMFYFSSDDLEMAGASPETLCRLTQGNVTTFPLAGTRPRGATLQEDARLEADLLSDEKELSEHNMLVDLARNDIGKISKIGTVSVTEYMKIHKYSHVMHIGSTVSGKIKDGLDGLDTISSILPAGTLSGAPKFRAAQIIEELEQCKRGVYGGAVGYLDFSGNLDTCIAIRLVYKKSGTITIRSGAGIVADSNPQSEAQECLNKARAVLNAVEQAAKGEVL